MPVQFVVTGFSKFEGVDNNPTEKIVRNLDDYVEKRGGIKGGASLSCCRVLQVGTKDVASFLEQQAGILKDSQETVVWLHLGVSALSRAFQLEQQAVNNASFSVPDEDGWQPDGQKIVDTEGLSIDSCIRSDLNVEVLVGNLREQGFDTQLSSDAGTFVCNWTYCSSLHLCHCRGSGGWHSLFVHVPHFQCIPEDTQMRFIVAVMDQISAHHNQDRGLNAQPLNGHCPH